MPPLPRVWQTQGYAWVWVMSFLPWWLPSSLLRVIPPLFAVSGACGDRIVDARLIRRRQNHGQQTGAVRRADHPEPTFVRLAGDRSAVADLLDLIRNDVMACNM